MPKERHSWLGDGAGTVVGRSHLQTGPGEQSTILRIAESPRRSRPDPLSGGGHSVDVGCAQRDRIESSAKLRINRTSDAADRH